MIKHGLWGLTKNLSHSKIIKSLTIYIFLLVFLFIWNFEEKDKFHVNLGASKKISYGEWDSNWPWSTSWIWIEQTKWQGHFGQKEWERYIYSYWWNNNKTTGWHGESYKTEFRDIHLGRFLVNYFGSLLSFFKICILVLQFSVIVFCHFS